MPVFWLLGLAVAAVVVMRRPASTGPGSAPRIRQGAAMVGSSHPALGYCVPNTTKIAGHSVHGILDGPCPPGSGILTSNAAYGWPNRYPSHPLACGRGAASGGAMCAPLGIKPRGNPTDVVLGNTLGALADVYHTAAGPVQDVLDGSSPLCGIFGGSLCAAAQTASTTILGKYTTAQSALGKLLA